MPWVFGLVLKWHDNSELSPLGDASVIPWPNGISKLSRSRSLRKSEESRARIAVDQEIEATSSLKDLINPKPITGKDFSDYEELDLKMAAELKWCYDIAYLIYEITERRAVTSSRAKNSYTERKTEECFQRKTIGLVQEDACGFAHTHVAGDLEDNVEWSGETQEILTQSKHTPQYRKWRNRLTEKNWTVWRPVLRLKLQIPCLWRARWKTIVVWLSTLSRVSWLQVWKQLHSWLSLPKSTSWWWEQLQREVEKTVLKDQLLFWKNQKRPRLCISKLRPMNSILRKVEELTLNASAGHTWNSQNAPSTTWIWERKKGNLEALSKKVNLMSQILAHPARRNNHLRKPHDKQIAPAKQRGIWRASRTLNHVFFLLWRRLETQKIVCLLCIRELQCTMLSKENWAQIQWIFWEGPKLHMRLTATGDSANKRVSTSFFVHGLDLFATVQLPDKTAAILLLHKHWSKRGKSYEWKTPQLTQNGKSITCIMDNSVQDCVVVGFYGMLLLSAKCPRPSGRRENSKWPKTWGILLGHAWFAERILGRRYSDCWDWRIGKVRCIRNISKKTEFERSPDNHKKWRIYISCGRWFSKIIRKRLRIPRTHSETGIQRKESESQRRISWREGRFSTWRNKRWWRNPKGFLGSRRSSEKIHLSSSYWTEKFNLRGKRRIIPYFQDSYYWTKPLREEIYNAGGELEKSPNIWGKHVQLYWYCRKGRNSAPSYNFAQEFVPMKRSQESSSPNFLWRWKQVRVVSSLGTAYLCDKIIRVTPKSPGSTSKCGPGKKEVWTPNVVLFSELRGIESYVCFRRLWRCVSQRRMPRETEKHKHPIFHSKQYWFPNAKATVEKEWKEVTKEGT